MVSQSERNLLFVVFALQHDLVSGQEVAEATSHWVRDKSQPISKIFANAGTLDEEEVQLLSRLVDKHIEKHGEEGEASLQAVGVMRPNSDQTVIEGKFQGDEEVENSLTILAAEIGSTYGHREDADRTTQGEPTEMPSMDFSVQTLKTRVDQNSGDFDGSNRFVRLRDHARGGLGTVFVAMDEQFNREVALKEIRTEYSDLDESQQRFFQEAIINGGLEHPGIVPVYAMGRNSDGKPYYAMRFIRGESLKRQLRRLHPKSKPIRWNDSERANLHRLLNHFVDSCNAIAYAHSRGIIHRDIKPSNIMIGKFGETLVVDWGLAKAVGREGSTIREVDEATLIPASSSKSGSSSTFETRIGQAIGTPQYMSPEQACGNVARIGKASDVFNLGATLYELLTGRAPYKGEQFDAIENGDFASPRQINATIDNALESICLKAMSKLPEDRYDSAEDLAADVEAWQADLAIEAHRDSAVQASRRWMRKNQSIVTGALAAAVMFAVGLGGLAVIVSQSNSRLQKANEAAIEARDLASENETLADEQSRVALDALNAIVFNVQSKLKDVPAASAARRQLLRSALDGLSRVSDRIRFQEGVERNQAQALMELGDVFISIGDDPALGTALEKGTTLLEQATSMRETLLTESNGDADIKRDLCNSLVKLVKAYELSGRSELIAPRLDQLLELSESLVEQEAEVENLLVLANTHQSVGDFKFMTGASADALNEFQQASSIIEGQLSNASSELRPDVVRLLAESLGRQGNTRLRLGSPEIAESDFRKCIALISDLEVDASETFGKQRLLSKFMINVGRSLFEQRKLDEALEQYKAAFLIREAAAQLDGANAQVQSELANSHSRLGEVYLHQREFEKSLASYEAARSIVLKLANADSTNTDFQLLLSQAFTNVAGAHFSMHNLEDSLKNHQRAREISEKLVLQDSNNANIVRDLAVTWLNIGLAYNRLKENEESITAFKNSIDACSRLYEIDPDDANVHDYSLACSWYLADIYEAQGKEKEVLITYRDAIRFADKVLEKNPQLLQVKADQAELKGYLALFQDDYPAAAEAAEAFASANPSNIDNYYNAACIYCIAATDADAEESVLKAWTTRAIACLSKSVELGYDDFENMRGDEDLAVLREDLRFQELFPKTSANSSQED